jgi:hypothetical protein
MALKNAFLARQGTLLSSPKNERFLEGRSNVLPRQN